MYQMQKKCRAAEYLWKRAYSRLKINFNNNEMSILKFAMIGAALGYGVYYVTKKREDGTSIMDDLAEKAPEWFDKGKQYATQTINQVTDNIKKYAPGETGEL